MFQEPLNGPDLYKAAAHRTTRTKSEFPSTLPAVFPDSPRSPYAPGPIRKASDAERRAVESFVSRHCEFGTLAHEALMQNAATYRDEEDHRDRQALLDEGVPLDGEWCVNPESDSPRWSDDA